MDFLGFSVPRRCVRSALSAPHNGHSDNSQTLRRVVEIPAPESGGKNRSIRVRVNTALIVHLLWETNAVYCPISIDDFSEE